nr:hypothetical protein [Tanacetum cinerariifolium]
MGQSLQVTLRGELGDVLVEKKTKHPEVCVMVLTGMSGKEYNNKLYLSSTSSMVFYDDDDIPCLQELRADDSAAPSKASLLIDCSQPRKGTLENLLIWERNRQNNGITELMVTGDATMTRKTRETIYVQNLGGDTIGFKMWNKMFRSEG